MEIQRYIRYGLTLSVTACFLFYSGGVLDLPFLDSLENHAYDARMRIMAAEPRHRHVAIVDIDENSLDSIGRWPWRRDLIADLVDVLFDHYQIKAMGFDVVFAEADEEHATKLLHRMAEGPLKTNRAFQAEYAKVVDSLQRDSRLARTLLNRRTVLGFIFGSSTRKGALPRPAVSLNEPLPIKSPLIEPGSYTANLEILQASAWSGGFFDNPLIDADGVYRRAPLLQRHQGRLYESLALALTRAALDLAQLELIARTSANDGDAAYLEWLKIDDLVIPVDEHAAVLIPYRGAQHSFHYISAIDVINKTAPRGELNGKIVLFGTSAPGLADLHTTPVATAFPGVEIHANIIQGILDQSIMHQPTYMVGIQILLVLTLGTLLAFLLPRLPPTWSLITSIAALILLVSVNLALWTLFQLVSPLASPALMIIVMFVLDTTYGYFVETRSKRRLARMFSQYVPPELVEEISRKPEKIHLNGELRDMSVLFADVHDFSTISEGMDPRELTRLINGFLTPMTEVIHQQRGTIDKYMGDAVMAFWGAPLEDPDHAVHALIAAVNMVQRLDELKAEFQARGWPEISIGIGVNSGAMNVGNKGSAFRVDYTVLGDAVNLGARLEALTRVYGVDIIAGANTQQAATGFEFRELDRVRVKGRDAPVAIYEPLGPAGTVDASLRLAVQQFHQALESYRQRRWDEAERALISLQQADPQCRLYRLYLDRIAHFREQPPRDDWDGSFSYESKF